MRSKFSVIIAIAASSVLPFASFAEGDTSKSRAGSVQDRPASSGSSSAQMDFSQLDANNDGIIDQAEANKSAQLKSDFKSMDKNADGKISRSEWSSHTARSGSSVGTGSSGSTGSKAAGSGSSKY